MKWAKQRREWQKKMQKQMASSQTGAGKVVSPHVSSIVFWIEWVGAMGLMFADWLL